MSKLNDGEFITKVGLNTWPGASQRLDTLGSDGGLYDKLEKATGEGDSRKAKMVR